MFYLNVLYKVIQVMINSCKLSIVISEFQLKEFYYYNEIDKNRTYKYKVRSDYNEVH